MIREWELVEKFKSVITDKISFYVYWDGKSFIIVNAEDYIVMKSFDSIPDIVGYLDPIYKIM